MILIAANFHYVRETFAAPHPSIFGVTPREFADQLDTLGRAGAFVGAADIADAVAGVRPLPERAIAVTFDDGLREQWELAWPILKAKGIPAIFYVNTSCIVNRTVETVHKLHILRSQIAPDIVAAELTRFVNAGGRAIADAWPAAAARQYAYDGPAVALMKYMFNSILSAADQQAFTANLALKYLAFDEAEFSQGLYMSPEQVLTLDRHGAIGTHSHRHVPLGLLAAEEARRDILDAMSVLRAWGCINVRSLSYPYGTREAVSPAAAAAAQEEGVVFAFTMERAASFDLNHPMMLPRYSNSDLPGGNAARMSTAELFDSAPAARWFA